MVVRINKTKNYTVMSNYHFQEKEMSLKAKGLLSLMLSLPDDWDYSIAGLVSICKESETAIKSTLNELKEFGYLKIIKTQNKDTGRFEYIYDIYEMPQKEENKGMKQQKENLKIENPEVENPGVDFPPLENQGQLNTKELNTKKLNNNTSTILNNIYNNIYRSFPQKRRYNNLNFLYVNDLE